MSTEDLHRLVGEANGKLDTLLDLMRDHVVQDEKRFGDVYDSLKSHDADINKAKGAKAALFVAAGAISGLVAVVAEAASRFLK